MELWLLVLGLEIVPAAFTIDVLGLAANAV